MARPFGEILTDLRGRRGITIEALAEAVDVSYTTIARCTARAVCPWRPQLKIAVLRALDGVARLTRAELDEYCQATDLQADSEIIRSALRSTSKLTPGPATAARGELLRQQFQHLLEACGQEERKVFAAVGDMIAQIGASGVYRILQTARSAIDQTASHDQTPTLAEKQRRMVFVNSFRFEDMDVTMHTPVDDPETSSPAKKARKHA